MKKAISGYLLKPIRLLILWKWFSKAIKIAKILLLNIKKGLNLWEKIFCTKDMCKMKKYRWISMIINDYICLSTGEKLLKRYIMSMIGSIKFLNISWQWGRWRNFGPGIWWCKTLKSLVDPKDIVTFVVVLVLRLLAHFIPEIKAVFKIHCQNTLFYKIWPIYQTITS